ncbi:glycosyl transferase [Mucilaginibacter kameinonensis]|uniref:glycosyl transferase n=1 Tax=Mucilaginibacter kameinonensis TaxID=452286 RepID=UPI0013CE49D6|nr:glycosyl transferase [Mucilaginibacter kameinonensis]
MLQKIINILYRYPKARLKTFKRFGGYRSYKKMIRLSHLMASKSAELPPVKSFEDGLPVYFLTGKKYLYQTLFCIQSLNRVANAPLRFILVDDGSFDEDLLAQIRKQLPGAGIVTRQMIEKNLNSILPEQRYPHLNHKRKVYPHIKKLTDIHTIVPSGWKVVLDSDMLFWNEPTELLNWLQNPTSPIYMLDCQESYGYSRHLMEELCGSKIPELLNVGVIGMNSADVNWDKIDRWIGVLEEKEGASYYLEQALTAMLLTGVKTEILPSNTYIVNPDSSMVNNAAGVLHHYVDLSKDDYFTTAWKKLI